MEESSLSHTREHTKHSNIPTFLIAALAFLIPVFFIPSAVAPFQFSKVLLVLTVVTVLFLYFTFQTFRTRTLSLPVSLSLYSLLLLPLATAVSSIFSVHPQVALFGYLFDADTIAFAALGSVLAIMTAVLLRQSKDVFSALLGLVLGGVVVIVFQILQIFFGGVPLAQLQSPIGNLIGGWNSLAVFLGLLLSLALVSLETLTLTRVSKAVVYGILVSTFVLLAIINFNVAWVLVALLSFAVFVHALTGSFARGRKGSDIGMKGAFAGIILVIALVMLITAGDTNKRSFITNIQEGLGIQTLEVRPSVEGTLAVLQSSFQKNALFGTGPNTFGFQWMLSRPETIVTTPFWNVAFSAGSGTILSQIATGGIVVATAWVIVIALLTISFGRALFSGTGAHDKNYFLVITTAVGSMYLLTVHLLYVPNQSLTLLMFLFFGLYFASLKGTSGFTEITVSFVKSPRVGFVAVFVLLLLSVGSLLAAFNSATLYASNIQYESAIAKSAEGSLDSARTILINAISLSEQDRYYRTLAAIELARLDSLVSSGASDEAAQNTFRERLTSAITAAQKSTDIGPKNHENWLARASVYGSVVPLQIEGAYESAEAALAEARALNPQSPEIDYRIARMKLALDDRRGARESAEASLQKKADYTPSILLLAQLSFDAGNLAEAIDAVAAAAVLEPTNPQLLYQLALLQLQDKRYEDARAVLEEALRIAPDYANASFFLGQTYAFLNRYEDALAQFKSLLERNADNQTLKDVIRALESGSNPFAVAPIVPDVETPTN